MALTKNAKAILKARYLQKGESPEGLFKRVAKNIASADKKYRQKSSERDFYNMMVNSEFLPNSPTLFNAGMPLQQLAACFVLPIEDEIAGIFETLKLSAIIHKSGGGTGFSFTHIRPKGDFIHTTRKEASGPVSFLKVFDCATEQIKQGGMRRGANMGILRVDHPDIEEFILAKQCNPLTNFNLSVGITDIFMKAVKSNKTYNLINPRTKKAVAKKNARKIFDLICRSAHSCGDPGVIFLDTINRKNPTPKLGKIESTNPCLPSDTWVMTGEGARRIEDIIGEKINPIINGVTYKSKGFFKTGKKRVYKLITKEGFEIEATEDHKFLHADKINRYKINKNWSELNSLKRRDKLILNNCTKIKSWKGAYTKGDGYLIGLLIGDGTFGDNRAILSCWINDKGHEGVKTEVDKIIHKLPHRKDFQGWKLVKKENKYRLRSTPLKKLAQKLKIEKGHKTITPEVERASHEFYRGFLRGFFDADGSVQGNHQKGISIRLPQSNLNILKRTQSMLLRLGIFSKIYQFRRNASKKALPDGKGGKKLYNIKPQHELIISNESIKKFYDLIGFCNTEKAKKLEILLKNYKRQLNKERFVVEVKEIKPIGIKSVFDANVDYIHSFDANGFLVHNCGEVPLLPYEACNLGSINLTKFVKNKTVDYERLKQVVWKAIHFLDNVIDMSEYPSPEIKQIVHGNRKIGLGVMGFAEMLIQLGISYASNEGIALAEKLMKFINDQAKKASVDLAKKRGVFPNFKGSIYETKKPEDRVRNATRTSIAPTGTISMIAGCSSSIEPLFGLAYTRHVLGRNILEINPHVKQILKKYPKALQYALKHGTLEGAQAPRDLKKVLLVAHQIQAEWHVKMQAAFQKHTDNAVSKTVNLPTNATVKSVERIIMQAYELGCKGISVYRHASKSGQILTLGCCA